MKPQVAFRFAVLLFMALAQTRQSRENVFLCDPLSKDYVIMKARCVLKNGALLLSCAERIFKSDILSWSNIPNNFAFFSRNMALKESELRVLGILGLVIVILWAFFGLVWSFLLVFTFLIYAYNFGRQQRNSSHEIGQDEPDVPFQDKMHDYYSEFQDLQFTGSPKGQFTLRSPMPLLSEVTKRLSFNTR